MFFKKIYILVLLLLPFSLGVFSQQLGVKTPVRFLALGDSYTIGEGVNEPARWPNQLVEALNNKGLQTEKLNIIAQTGWRTDNLLYGISTYKPDSNYNLVSLLIGVNNQYQGKNISIYPIEFRQLLETAVELCGGKKEGVFVLSIPDYGYTPFGMSNQSTISAEIDLYNQINRRISGEMGVAYFDITPISREVISKPEYLASDMLHPSGEMYAKWIELILNSSKLEVIISNTPEYQQSEQVVVYPNPASSQVTLQVPENVNTLEIYNSQGSKVFQLKITTMGKINIDVSSWNSGVYYFRIHQNKNTFLPGKFLIK